MCLHYWWNESYTAAHKGTEHTLTLWPLKANSDIAILHACALTFSDLSLKVVFLCLWAAQAPQERPAEQLHVGSPRSDLQSYCIKRTIFITTLHTSPFSCCMENITLVQTQVLLHSCWKAFQTRLVWGGGLVLWNRSLLLGCFKRWSNLKFN